MPIGIFVGEFSDALELGARQWQPRSAEREHHDFTTQAARTDGLAVNGAQREIDGRPASILREDKGRGSEQQYQPGYDALSNVQNHLFSFAETPCGDVRLGALDEPAPP